MLRQSIPPHQQSFESSSSTENDDNNQVDLNRALLLEIIQENHLLYHMENRDRPNNIIRVLVELHRLGATQEQLSLAYQKARLDAQPIRISTKINEKNWEEYLGTASLYSDYVLFFDNQLLLLGLEETLNRYFYSIPTSIGSQLQPLVQLAFGIQHDLSQIITQALAYYATSYMDVSNILSYCQERNNTTTTTTTNTIANTLLFDFIRSDQRFDGKIEGNNTFNSSVKLLLKSKSDLLKTYMTSWSTMTQNYTLQQRLDALTHSAVTLTHISSRQQQYSSIDLDWFLAGGQLLDASLAIKTLIRTEEEDVDLIHLLFLSIVCSFVVQGRPSEHDHHIVQYSTNVLSWESCIQAVIQSTDPKSILALASIHTLSTLQNDPMYLYIANTYAQFVSQDGTWIKGGVGWIH